MRVGASSVFETLVDNHHEDGGNIFDDCSPRLTKVNDKSVLFGS
jgi:hypothetical protein